MVSAVQYFTISPPQGMLQPEPSLSGLNTSTNQQPWTPALKNIQYVFYSSYGLTGSLHLKHDQKQ